MPEQANAYWADDEAGLFSRFKTSQAGLSANEAAQRLKSYGSNRVDDKKIAGPLRLLARQFESPLLLVLIFGAVLSLILQQ